MKSVTESKHFSAMPTRSKKEKENIWKKVMESNVDRWKKLWDISSLDDTKDRIMMLFKLEIEGGRCFHPDCLKEWKHIQKENMYHKIDYYQPGCHCFYRCPLCGRSNHLEMENGTLEKNGYRCFCGWRLVDDNKNKKHGNRFEKENFDFLNRIREKHKIYFTEFDGQIVITRERK